MPSDAKNANSSCCCISALFLRYERASCDANSGQYQ